MQRKLRSLAEGFPAVHTGEGLEAVVKIDVFFKVLHAGVEAVAYGALKPFNPVMRDFYVPFEVELGRVGFLTVRCHAAVKVDVALVHLFYYAAIMSRASSPLSRRQTVL